MSPSHANKAGVRYRYYVSQALLQHRKNEAGSIARVSAPDVEAAILGFLPLDRSELSERIARITLHRDRLIVHMKGEQDEPPSKPIAIPFAWQPQGRRKGIVHEPASKKVQLAPSIAKSILIAISRARRWMAELIEGIVASPNDIAIREGMGERNVRKLLPLACLSPALVRAIVDGTAPADLTISSLTAALPHDWAAQEQRFLTA
ncbi:hypothetical protein MWN34_00005 [Ancylobacter sp. 6x-1]|uniref:Uncharacterized protein n=1 Tax=Ancylobacter crimeensis TaxID=2579147 RepID=A0ABT0D5S0_9HYPH|nr:hypothetical protein [Ancylobacter crimeensis]MCK0195291.1 hypothetical protein [Ancylobacter crimeensis]